MSLFRRVVTVARIVPSSGSRQVTTKRSATQSLSCISTTQVRTFKSSSFVSAEGDADEVKRCTTEVAKPSARVLRIADDVLALNLLEINQLLRSVQKRLGLPDDYFKSGGMGGGGGAPRVAAAGAGSAAAAAPVKEKEAFDLKLTEVDAKAKIKIIKEVRAITGLGLKEAKEMVENAPVVVKQGLKKDEAEKLQKILVEAGAKAELL